MFSLEWLLFPNEADTQRALVGSAPTQCAVAAEVKEHGDCGCALTMKAILVPFLQRYQHCTELFPHYH